MANKSTIEKYNILFSSSIEFTFRVGLYKPQDIEGASDDEILSLCQQYNITKLPEVLWSYAYHFGRKANIRNSNSSIAAHTMADFEYALHQANLKDEWNGGQSMKELFDSKNPLVNYDYDYPIGEEGLYTPPIKSLMKIDDIIFFGYDPFSRSFKFADGSKENPEVFHSTRLHSVSSLFSSFTNRFRSILFMFIASYAGDDFVEMAMIDGKLMPVGQPPIIDYSGGFEIIKEYQDIFKNRNLSIGKVKALRGQFYLLNNKVEEEENRILSFNEFERKFIDFMYQHL